MNRLDEYPNGYWEEKEYWDFKEEYESDQRRQAESDPLTELFIDGSIGFPYLNPY